MIIGKPAVFQRKGCRLLPETVKFVSGIHKYESLLKDNTHKSFKDRFRSLQFQNTYGHTNGQLGESIVKEIGVIMELRYPFVVNLE